MKSPNRSDGFRRLIAAGMYGQAITTASQLILTPLLLYYWGAPAFGLWVLLYGIPALFAQSDLGVAAAAGNYMQQAVLANDRRTATRYFNTALLLIGAPTLLVVAISILVALHCFDETLAHLFASIPRNSMSAASMLLLYLATSLISGLVNNALRANNQYAAALLVYDTSRLIEGIAIGCVAAAGLGILAAAIAALLARLIGVSVALFKLRQTSTWLRIAPLRLFDSQLMSQLWRPSLSLAAIPAGAAVSLQGILWVAGLKVGVDAVAAMSSLRTLVRAAVQLSLIISRALSQPFARAWFQQDFSRAARLFDKNLMLIATLLISFLIFMSFCGLALYTFWTKSAIYIDNRFLLIMTLGAVIHGAWMACSALLSMANLQSSYGPIYLTLAALSVTCAFLLPTTNFLNGCAWIIVAGETIMLAIILRKRRYLRRME